MAEKKDWHAEGEKDREKSYTRSDCADIMADTIFGGSYNPPSDSDDKKEYDAGWDNASV